MRRVILDTDVASLSIKQRLPPALLRELLGAQIGITFITLGELTRWATLRQWGPTRRAELDAWLADSPDAPLHRRRRTPLGRDLRPRDPTRSSPPAERHVDRGLLPGLRPSPRDLERQGLQGLRRARGPDVDRHLMLDHGLAAGLIPWSHSWSELPPMLPVEPATRGAPLANPQISSHARPSRAIPKPCVAGSNPAGGHTAGGTQVREIDRRYSCSSWSHLWSELAAGWARAALRSVISTRTAYAFRPPRRSTWARVADRPGELTVREQAVAQAAGRGQLRASRLTDDGGHVAVFCPRSTAAHCLSPGSAAPCR